MRRTHQARRRQARLTGEVTERLTQIALLQASGQERRERKRVSGKSTDVADAMVARAAATGVTRAIAEAPQRWPASARCSSAPSRCRPGARVQARSSRLSALPG